jgi:queuine tRNA-ribosyltransferase
MTTPSFQAGHRRQGAARRDLDTARGRYPHAGLHAGGHGGTVKAMYLDQVRDLRRRHHSGQHLSPDAAAGRRARGAAWRPAQFCIRWDYPILTDSGGFQVMSLAALRKITEDGVTFQSHIDGSRYEMSPERSIEIQGLLGSDIQMQLDECVLPAEAERDRARWNVAALGRALQDVAFGEQPGKAMFGIVQGGDIPKLRERSAAGLAALGPEGLCGRRAGRRRAAGGDA